MGLDCVEKHAGEETINQNGRILTKKRCANTIFFLDIQVNNYSHIFWKIQERNGKRKINEKKLSWKAYNRIEEVENQTYKYT